MKRKEPPVPTATPVTPQLVNNFVKAGVLHKDDPNKKHKYPAKRQKVEHQQSGDNPSTVASHYNAIKDTGVMARRESPIIQLKTFNNWIKSILIAKYVKQNGCVLDLCCGKGGDFQKFDNRPIKLYYGADIAEESVKDAAKRYNESATIKKKFQTHPKPFKFTAKFIAGDLCNAQLSTAIPKDVWFDSVSCQFALHYSFETEHTARQLLQNATEKLKQGGHFICTVPDAYVLVKKLRASDSYTVQNKVSKAVFTSKEFTHPYGNKYVFDLTDAITSCPEYLVPPVHFKNLAAEYGLNIVEEKNFHSFYEKYSEDTQFEDIHRVYHLKDGQMTPDQWDAIYLYRVFVFQKGDDNQGGEQGYNPSLPTGFSAFDIRDIKHLQPNK